MTSVETIARIRFEHFQNRKGIKRIARELGVARDTVRKVLRSLRWPRDFGQGDKLFPLERETGRYGQGDTEAVWG
jgi:hypothetical protein